MRLHVLSAMPYSDTRISKLQLLTCYSGIVVCQTDVALQTLSDALSGCQLAANLTTTHKMLLSLIEATALIFCAALVY